MEVGQEPERLIAPAPLMKVTEILNELNANLPGTVTIDKHGQLLKNYLRFGGFAQPMIEAYNHWIFETLQQQIASVTITLPSNKAVSTLPDEIIHFDRYYIDNPSVSSHDGTIVPDFPALAMEAGRTYAASVYADLVSDHGKRNEKVFLFKVPVMLGSNLDNLKDKTDAEKLRLRHDPHDPNGYFIIKDAEKLVLLQEKLRANKSLLYYDTKKLVPVCKMTCLTIRGSKIVSLAVGKKHKTIKLSLQFLGKGNSMPVFSAFRLLGVTDTNTMFQYVSQFVKQDAKILKKVYFVLQASFMKLLAIGSDVEYIARKRGTSNLPTLAKEEGTRRGVLEDLFPQVPIDQPQVKLQMLSILVARLAEHMAGFREFDDRDSWSNKRLDSAAKAMEQLFMGLWNRMHGEIEKKISAGKIKDFEHVGREIAMNTITSDFVSSFSSNNWGIKEKYHKENITDYLKRGALTDTFSHLLRVNTPTSQKTRSSNLREVQETALGIICPAESPEGPTCGITKNLALTAYLSVDRNDLLLKQAITPFILGQPTVEGTSKCLLNGIFLGWCAGNTLRDFCISQKRNGRFHKDICIVLDRDDFLYIYCDGSRAMRPLLIVDTDGKRVIDKKNMWNASFDELLRSGCAEYVDASEQETIMLAQSIWDMEGKDKQRSQAVRYLEEAQQALLALQQQGAGIEGAGIGGDDDEDGGWIGGPVETRGVERVIRTEAGIEMRINTVKDAEKAVQQASEVLMEMQRKRPFTHCELDPQAIMGLAAAIMPMADKSQAPRVTYQCSMIKQALGIYHSNYLQRFDTTAKVLAFPSRPLFEPQMNAAIGMDEMPAGSTVVVAIMTFLGFNQEDAIIVKKEAIDRGLFAMVKYMSHKSLQKQSREYVEKFERPPVRKGEPVGRYAHLDDNGIVRLGSQVRQGDCIVGKTRRNTTTGEVSNASVYIGLGEDGIVDRVVVSYNTENALVAKVKIRRVHSPIEGDKFASRYAQKGTIGLILPARDMPFNEVTGMVPDIIINPHCVTGDTQVTLFNGMSRRIDQMNSEGCELVQSLNGQGLTPNYSLGMTAMGVKPIIKLFLEDGRTLKCTPDHKIYVQREGSIQKIEAGQLQNGTDRIIMGIDAPLDIIGEDEKGWKLETSDIKFDMSTKLNREKSLAFARLLGYVLTDGCINKDKRDSNSYNCPLSMGHGMDVNMVLQDIQLITGKSPKPRHSEGVWVVNLPAKLGRSMARLVGMTIGRRTEQEASLPHFLLYENCPKSIIREFLGGFYGGDGAAPLIQEENLSPIILTQSINVLYKESLGRKMDCIIWLLARIGVEAKFSRWRDYEIDQQVNNVKTGNIRNCVSCEIRINSILDFSEKVGYRYCVDKTVRNNAALSYVRLRENVSKQHSKLYELVDEILQEKDLPISASGNTDMNFVLERARFLLLKDQPALNEYYSLSNITALRNYSKENRKVNLKSFRRDQFPTAREYFESIGALDWFNVHGTEHRHYIVKHSDSVLPTYSLRLLDKRDAGSEMVYDIGVAVDHNFVANGIIISNCIPFVRFLAGESHVVEKHG